MIRFLFNYWYILCTLNQHKFHFTSTTHTLWQYTSYLVLSYPRPIDAILVGRHGPTFVGGYWPTKIVPCGRAPKIVEHILQNVWSRSYLPTMLENIWRRWPIREQRWITWLSPRWLRHATTQRMQRNWPMFARADWVSQKPTIFMNIIRWKLGHVGQQKLRRVERASKDNDYW